MTSETEALIRENRELLAIIERLRARLQKIIAAANGETDE